jgi:DNA-binding Lrp family transcriptional regulator
LSSRRLTDTQVKIYLYILTHSGDVSVRDIARDLDLSPSTVHYNLKRLEELGYIEKSANGYVVKNPVKLREYVIVGRLIIPRLLIYGLFFTGIFAGTVVYTILTEFTGDRLLTLLVSLIAAILFYLEAIKTREKTLA